MKPVFIKLDKERELRFGNKAMIRFKELTGTTIFKVFQSFENNEDFDILVFNQMLYVALLAKNPDINDLDQVIDLVDEYLDIDTLTKKCMEAFNESGFFPKASNSKKK